MVTLTACATQPGDREFATSIASGRVAACPAGSVPAAEAERELRISLARNFESAGDQALA